MNLPTIADYGRFRVWDVTLWSITPLYWAATARWFADLNRRRDRNSYRPTMLLALGLVVGAVALQTAGLMWLPRGHPGVWGVFALGCLVVGFVNIEQWKRTGRMPF